MILSSKNIIGLHFRFANIFKVSDISVDNISNAVKAIKHKSSLEKSCISRTVLLTSDNQMTHVKAVEQELQLESSDQVVETMTKEELQSSAEMFIYLIMCPEAIVPWFTYYNDLFLTKSVDQIILSLNRIMKTKSTQNMDAKGAENLLKRISNLMLLQFERIQNLLPGKNLRNGSSIDLRKPNGMYMYDVLNT